MKSQRCVNLLVVVFFMACITGTLHGQEARNQCGDWQVQLMPYFWTPEIKSDSTLSGVEGAVELSFSDVLDLLDFVAMGRIEAWHEQSKWGVTFDSFYINLGADNEFETPVGALDNKLNIDIRLGMLDFGLAYRCYDFHFGQDDQQRFMFEPYAGLRYSYLRQKAKLEVNVPGLGAAQHSIGDSKDWVEPFVGGRIRWDLNENFALTLRGDAGGFGIGSASTLTWNIIPGLTYKLNENTTFDLSYRILDMDYSNGSGSNKFAMDLRANGPVFGVTIIY